MDTLLDKIRSTNYDFYYISIGSGCTEQIVPNLPLITRSNCEFQLFPNFIRNNDKVLHIVIEPSFIQETRKVIGHFKKELPNVTTYFLFLSVPETNVEQSPFFELFQALISLWNQKQIPKNKIVIINFIQFKLQKEIERTILLSEQIYKSLQNPTEQNAQLDNSQRQNHYHHCLYIWFGYSPLLYNCFHKYKYYDNQEKTYKYFFDTFDIYFHVRNSHDFHKNVLLMKTFGINAVRKIRKQKINVFANFFENNLHLIEKNKLENIETIFLKNSFCLLHSNLESFYNQLD